MLKELISITIVIIYINFSIKKLQLTLRRTAVCKARISLKVTYAVEGWSSDLSTEFQSSKSITISSISRKVAEKPQNHGLFNVKNVF